MGLTDSMESAKLNNERLMADLLAVNPNVDKGLEYQVNCGYCAAAFEMRRRGHDVEAAPLTTGQGIAREEWCDLFEGFQPLSPRSLTPEDVISEMELEILSWGNGARGTVLGLFRESFAGRPGHIFSFEVMNGRVVFVDAQDAGINAVQYLKDMRPDSIEYGRLNNLKPSAKTIRVALRKRGR